MRCDSTVQESDVRIPTDCGLAADAVKVLARVARNVHAVMPDLTRRSVTAAALRGGEYAS
jgi:hypothetical protein